MRRAIIMASIVLAAACADDPTEPQLPEEQQPAVVAVTQAPAPEVFEFSATLVFFEERLLPSLTDENAKSVAEALVQFQSRREITAILEDDVARVEGDFNGKLMRDVLRLTALQQQK